MEGVAVLSFAESSVSTVVHPAIPLSDADLLVAVSTQHTGRGAHWGVVSTQACRHGLHGRAEGGGQVRERSLSMKRQAVTVITVDESLAMLVPLVQPSITCVPHPVSFLFLIYSPFPSLHFLNIVLQ